MTIDDELSPLRDPYLKNMLEDETRRQGGSSETHKDELRDKIEGRERDLLDDERMYRLFEEHRDALPKDQRPTNKRQDATLFVEWESLQKSELQEWKEELAVLEVVTVDGQLVLQNVRERLMRLLEAEARDAGLIRRTQSQILNQQRPSQADFGIATTSSYVDGWVSLAGLTQRENTNDKSNLQALRGPRGYEIAIKNWRELLVGVAEWLIQEGLLEKGARRISIGNATKRYLIHSQPKHSTGLAFQSHKRLSNGLYIDDWGNKDTVAKRVSSLVQRFGQDPAEFHVLFTQ